LKKWRMIERQVIWDKGKRSHHQYNIVCVDAQ
jgi:hypothetical protein